MTTPTVPWMGDKRRMADRLIPLLPLRKCYVEIFAGGAAFFFVRLQPTLYSVVQASLEAFMRQSK